MRPLVAGGGSAGRGSSFEVTLFGSPLPRQTRLTRLTVLDPRIAGMAAQCSARIAKAMGA
jgi:hypothetical protein